MSETDMERLKVLKDNIMLRTAIVIFYIAAIFAAVIFIIPAAITQESVYFCFFFIAVYYPFLGLYNNITLIKSEKKEKASIEEKYGIVKTETKTKISIKINWTYVLTVVVILFFIILKPARNALIDNRYNKAVNFYLESEYIRAENLFESIENANYKDTSSYLMLIDAGKSSDQDPEECYETAKMIRFDYASDEEKEKINENIDYLCEKAEEVKTEREFFENLKENGIPYIGLSEEYIEMTSLGKKSTWYMEAHVVGNEIKNVKVYEFNLPKSHRTQFLAYVLDGKVVDVANYIDNPHVTWHTSNILNTKHTYSENHLDVQEYDNAEDFYDENEDWFESYDDAEDYYNEYRR